MPDPLERIIVRILDAQLNSVKPARNRALLKYGASADYISLTDRPLITIVEAATAICGNAICGTALCGDGP